MEESRFTSALGKRNFYYNAIMDYIYTSTTPRSFSVFIPDCLDLSPKGFCTDDELDYRFKKSKEALRYGEIKENSINIYSKSEVIIHFLDGTLTHLPEGYYRHLSTLNPFQLQEINFKTGIQGKFSLTINTIPFRVKQDFFEEKKELLDGYIQYTFTEINITDYCSCDKHIKDFDTTKRCKHGFFYCLVTISNMATGLQAKNIQKLLKPDF